MVRNHELYLISAFSGCHPIYNKPTRRTSQQQVWVILQVGSTTTLDPLRVVSPCQVNCLERSEYWVALRTSVQSWDKLHTWLSMETCRNGFQIGPQQYPSLCTYLLIYIYIYMCNIHTCTCMCTYACIYIYIYTCAHIFFVSTYTHAYIKMFM